VLRSEMEGKIGKDPGAENTLALKERKVQKEAGKKGRNDADYLPEGKKKTVKKRVHGAVVGARKEDGTAQVHSRDTDYRRKTCYSEEDLKGRKKEKKEQYVTANTLDGQTNACWQKKIFRKKDRKRECPSHFGGTHAFGLARKKKADRRRNSALSNLGGRSREWSRPHRTSPP